MNVDDDVVRAEFARVFPRPPSAELSGSRLSENLSIRGSSRHKPVIFCLGIVIAESRRHLLWPAARCGPIWVLGENDMVPTVQTAPIGSTRSSGVRLALGALVVLAVCEVIVLQLYLGAMRRVTELTVDLEYARGSAVVASAQANRCEALGLQK